MEIYFRSQQLQKLLGSKIKLEKKYGKNAKMIMRRLKEIQYTANLADLINTMPGKHHSLKGNRNGQFACHLLDGKRLIYIPADDPLPLDENSALIYHKVISVEIIEIEDYH